MTIPVCRWRETHASGKATCASPKVRGGQNGFDAEKVCSTCAIADHEPLTPEQIAARNQPRSPVPAHGPGTELKAMLAELGISPENCNCNARAAQMNRWGAACKEHRLEIAAWLKEAATNAVTEFKVDDPIEAFLPLVDEAIRRAEVTSPDRKD